MCVAVTQQQDWSAALHERIAQAIRNAREGRLSAQQLADETERLGYPISRSQIANYESGRKQGLDVAELLVLAAALEVPPVALLFGGHPDQDVEMLPGQSAPTFHAIAWFSGDRELAWPGPDLGLDEARDQADQAVADPDSPAATVLRLIRKRAALHRDYFQFLLASKPDVAKWDDEQFDRALTLNAGRIGEICEITDEITRVITENEGQTE